MKPPVLSTWSITKNEVVRQATRFGLPDIVPNNVHPLIVAQCYAWIREGFPFLDIESGSRRSRAATLMIWGLPVLPIYISECACPNTS
jgi:hypothetical protein